MSQNDARMSLWKRIGKWLFESPVSSETPTIDQETAESAAEQVSEQTAEQTTEQSADRELNTSTEAQTIPADSDAAAIEEEDSVKREAKTVKKFKEEKKAKRKAERKVLLEEENLLVFADIDEEASEAENEVKSEEEIQREEAEQFDEEIRLTEEKIREALAESVAEEAEVPETAKVPEAAKVPEEAKAPEAVKVPETAKVPEEAKVSEELETPEEPETTLSDKERRKCYTNRELSWLKFNERVLNEAGNPEVPLGERLSFASIYQTNLDEFFQVRVGTMRVQMDSKEKIRDNKTGMSSKEQVKAIFKKVRELEEKKSNVYEQLMGELEPAGIRLLNFNRLSNEEGRLLEAYFDAHIAPFLSPMIIGSQQPFPFLMNKQLYLVLTLGSLKGKKGGSKIGVIPCSNHVFKRLIEIPTRPGTFMLSEELIQHFAEKLYPKYTIKERFLVRLTRNADIEIADVYDEDMDYRDVMEKLIKKRTRLNSVRVELSKPVSAKMMEQLSVYLDTKQKYFVDVRTPLDLGFVFDLQNYLRLKNRDDLFYEKRVPQLSPDLDANKPITPQLEKKDVLLYYPYQSIRPFLRMLQEAAEDKDVVSIKMTLYRVAERSQIIDTLIDAAENGKEVVVLVELRARFDEANNIEMSKRLEEAGCQIFYGLEGFKVHSKLCLITRRKGDGFEYITQVGTGNYNEKTARLYTDLSLMTANQEIGSEIADVFTTLQKGEFVEQTNQLLVAPKCFQSKIVDLIEEQIENAREGKPAYIGAKINSLTDKTIMDKLIDASCAGVKIELIIRGICCLVPGVPGLTENIRVISIVGRFLEHSRIYRFGVGEEEQVYIGSADFMTRNTIRRVEVAAKILDPDVRSRVQYFFETSMRDDVKGKEQDSDGIYQDRSINEKPLNSQEFLYSEAYRAASGITVTEAN